jgi:hypothetical protein
MSAPANVKLDQGAINERLLAQHAAADYRRVEGAGVKLPIRLASPDAKRAFLRYFHTLQLNCHFISNIGRLKLEEAQIEQIEEAIKRRLERLGREIAQAIEQAEILLRHHGITELATYDTQPLEMQVSVLSSASRRFLEVLMKLDQLMPMLQTLDVYEVIKSSEHERRRRLYKTHMRAPTSMARMSAIGIRKLIVEREQAEQMPAQDTAPGITGAEGISEVLDAQADSGLAENEAAQSASSNPQEVFDPEDSAAITSRVKAEVH